jgi:sugar phosphate isomerase/epimerase
MLHTRTGSLGIGFRRGWSDWQKDLSSVISFAQANGFTCIDIGGNPDEAKQIHDAGLKVGSADLWMNDILSADADTRKAAAEKATALVAELAARGVTNYFSVMLPPEPNRARAENFDFMVDGLRQVAPALESANGKLVIEGWPGPGALCCTPESYRATFEAVGSPAIGINFDPSHLLRMRIDPVRFALEFADRIHHVHGKDTEWIDEATYEYGIEQPATHGKPHGFGAMCWRYTIPGHGETRWTELFRILTAHGYNGLVSIELEDENFNGSEEGEKAGLLAGGQYLASC